MEAILVPIDFSSASDNALQYAIELSKYSRADLILLHTFKAPIPIIEMPFVNTPIPNFEEDNLLHLKEIEKKIGGNVQVESIVRQGFVVDEIINVIKEKEIDLVVMGITGSGKIGEKLMGSHTTSLIKKTLTPVLMVPAGAHYNKISKILLAYDYKEVVNIAALELFKKFAKLFQAQVLVLDVEHPDIVSLHKNSATGEDLENSFEDIQHTTFISTTDNLTDEINKFAESHQCDWIAMIPHTHNVFSRLFRESNTKKMAFHTHIPLLSIHD